MFIVKNRKFFFALSALLVVLSVVSVLAYGLNLGIDFKGGSMLEVSYEFQRPEMAGIRSSLDALDLGNYVLTPSGASNYILKTRDLNPAEKTVVLSAFQTDTTNPAKEERFNSLGPVVGNQLKNKALIAICLVVLAIVLFITFAFRKVSVPVASWKYGLATIVALAHDVIIPTGVFVAWIHFNGGELDLLFVTALLAILGYSVHDTIVVFDRVRENLKVVSKNESFIETVGKSVTQTFGRSINTSLTIFLALVSVYFLGGASTRDFAFVLLIGVIAGTYSSIFVASPLLVTLEKLQKKA
ncbi:MAG: protein translocase subunit SecF [Parcubacteria group bacterium]